MLEMRLNIVYVHLVDGSSGERCHTKASCGIPHVLGTFVHVMCSIFGHEKESKGSLQKISQ